MKTSKQVLITGATSGIGRHAARHLARQGHRVFATGRRVRELETLKAEAESSGVKLDVIELDVTSESSRQAARKVIMDKTDGHGIDVLVNNAGYGLFAPLAEVTEQDLRRQFETNVFGLMAITQLFLPEMQKRREGRILNVSSVGGRMTLPFGGAYHATKYAVEAMSDALRMELRAFDIYVVLIEPGMINTEFAAQSMSLIDAYRNPDSPYAPALAKARDLEAAATRMGVDPTCISEAIERAATARRPSARYVAPFRTYFALAFMKWMPTALVDWLLRVGSGLTRAKLGQTASPDLQGTRRIGAEAT